ncbi:MAG TPA: DoxX family protein [Pirellulales bacterium]|jgi:putative oxidoreductase|nr:DoxX family protein [Pirellulales bacterium]
MSPNTFRFVAPLGRLLLSLIFVASAAGKISDWQSPAKMMADKGVPAVDALLSIAIALEISGGVLVLLGWYTRFGALALLLFLVPVTLIMHNFWTIEEGPQRMEQMINFMKNVSISGGLVMVLALGPGPLSLDGLAQPKPKPTVGP